MNLHSAVDVFLDQQFVDLINAIQLACDESQQMSWAGRKTFDPPLVFLVAPENVGRLLVWARENHIDLRTETDSSTNWVRCLLLACRDGLVDPLDSVSV